LLLLPRAFAQTIAYRVTLMTYQQPATVACCCVTQPCGTPPMGRCGRAPKGEKIGSEASPSNQEAPSWCHRFGTRLALTPMTTSRNGSDVLLEESAQAGKPWAPRRGDKPRTNLAFRRLSGAVLSLFGGGRSLHLGSLPR
jgi:hypothetical protein